MILGKMRGYNKANLLSENDEHLIDRLCYNTLILWLVILVTPLSNNTELTISKVNGSLVCHCM